jgi:hypothetical protein
MEKAIEIVKAWVAAKWEEQARYGDQRDMNRCNEAEDAAEAGEEILRLLIAEHERVS